MERDAFEILDAYQKNRSSVKKNIPIKNGTFFDGSTRYFLDGKNSRVEKDLIIEENFSIQQKDLLFAGVDYFRFAIFAKNETEQKEFSNFIDIFRSLDYDNSSDGCFRIFGKDFDVSRSGQNLYFSWNGTKIFSLRLLSVSEKENKSLPKEFTAFLVDFYGLSFASTKIGVFDIFDFGKNFQIFSNKKVYRLDFAFDFSLTHFQILSNSNFGVCKNPYLSNEAEGKQEIETLYFSPKSDKNKSAYIRLYDKKLLAKKLNQEVFYPYIMENENVTRLEVQFNSKMIEEMSFIFDDFFNFDKILGCVKSYLQSKSKYFDFFIDIEKVKRIRKAIVSQKSKEDYFFERVQKIFISAENCGVSPKRLKNMYYQKKNIDKIPQKRKQ